jgi:predicted PurR-regulated permease PerM
VPSKDPDREVKKVNPVAVILSLIFRYWMCGLLAVPMLAIIKIVCDRTAPA